MNACGWQRTAFYSGRQSGDTDNADTRCDWLVTQQRDSYGVMTFAYAVVFGDLP